MKIYGIFDYSLMFIGSTLGWAVENLDKYIKNCEVKVYPYEDLKTRRIELDYDQDIIFLFEIGNPQHCRVSTQDLRKVYPHAKFVCFCSDTMYYQVNNLPRQMDPNGIDLHLELVPQCIDKFKEDGIDAELWMWTGSDRLFELATQYKSENWYNKQYDFIGVYGPWTIDNKECWRHNAVEYIKNQGYTFTQGGGNGWGDIDLGRLFQAYMDSYITLGTTSHNRPELTKLGTQKGFRDWLGPILGNLLIYDNHPNIMNIFNKDENIVPTYDYDNFQTILNCYDRNVDEEIYSTLVEKQKLFAINNTIDKQLVRIFLKKGWVTQDQCI